METKSNTKEALARELEIRRKQVGEKINSLRKSEKFNYSLRQLSELMNERGVPVSPSQISRIENGEAFIDDGQRMVFSKIFEVSEDELKGINSGDQPWFIIRKDVADNRLAQVKEGNIENTGIGSPHKLLIDNKTYRYVKMIDAIDSIKPEDKSGIRLNEPRMRKYLIEIKGADPVEVDGQEAIEGLARHEGEEIIYVISGHLNFWFQHSKLRPIEKRILHPGDCLQFSSRIYHAFSAVNEPAQALFIFSDIQIEMEIEPTTEHIGEKVINKSNQIRS